MVCVSIAKILNSCYRRVARSCQLLISGKNRGAQSFLLQGGDLCTKKARRKPGFFVLLQGCQLDDPVGDHCIGHFDEAADIGAKDIIARCAIFLRRFKTVTVDVDHDVFQFFLGIFETP